MKIIGLNGVAQSGKDTTGNYIVTKHNFARVAFADAIRDELYILNPIVCILPEESKKVENLMGIIQLQFLVDKVGWENAKQVKMVRELLQRQGDASRQTHGSDCWSKIVERKIIMYQKVVVTDVRCKDETEFIRNLGGKIIRVSREGVNAVNSHYTENRLPDELIDIEIENNGSIIDLHNKIDAIMDEKVLEAKAS